MAGEPGDLVDKILRRPVEKPEPFVPPEKRVPVAPATQVPEGKVVDQVLERLKRQRLSSGS